MIRGPALALLVLACTVAPETRAESFASCMRELTGVFYNSQLPNHAVISDAEHAPTQELGPSLIENTKRVYEEIPQGMVTPTHGTVEFTPVEWAEDSNSAFSPTLLQKQDPTHGKILWEAPAKLGDTRIYLDIHSHELGHKISMVNLQKTDPELYEEITKAYRADPTGGTVADIQNAIVATQEKMRRLQERTAFQISAEDPLQAYREANQSLKHLHTELRRAELLKKYGLSRDELLSVWSEYDEVFADLVSINASGNPKAMKESVLATGGRKAEAEARDFTVDHGYRFDGSSDEHQVLARTRSHLWKQYLSGATPERRKKVVQAYHQAAVQELRRLYENPELIRRSGRVRNDDLIRAIDRQMSKP